MKSLALLLISLVVTCWIVAIAIISVQNYTPVSIKFLTFRSIEIPLGLILAFSGGLGILGTALIQPLWGYGSSRQSENDDDVEFTFEE